MTKPWTRNQKLILAGIIAPILAGTTIKINFDIHYLKNEVNELKAENAKIQQLESEFAKIEQIISESIQANNISTGKCPEGSNPGISFGNNGTVLTCIPENK